MKTIYFLLLFLFLGWAAIQAQHVPYSPKSVPVSSNVPNKPLLLERKQVNPLKAVSGQGPLAERNGSAPTAQTIAVLGSTTYDLQSNAANCNRIYKDGNSIAATWISSNILGPPFPDRGTGYNYFDGTVWLSTSTIDTLSWPNIDKGALNTEYVVGHKSSNPGNTLSLFKRTPAGTGNWIEIPMPAHPSGLPVLWPRMRVGGPNGSTIHVIAAVNGLHNGVFSPLTYSRSQDGGLTWDLQYVALPFTDPTQYAEMGIDAYAIDVRDNVVAIVHGYLYNDWALWKSTDNGTTFTKTVIDPFPIPAYDYNLMITDTSGDAVADTINSIDGGMAVLIDNLNNVHSWAGSMLVLQDAPGAIGYFEYSDGLMYWNETSAGPVMIASTIDMDGSGVIEVPDGIQGEGYNSSLTGMPTAGIDATSNILLAYSGILENTTNGNPDPSLEEAFKNVFVMASPDNGVTWTTPYQVSPSSFDEQVFPSIARNVGPKLDLIFMQDGEPGISVTGSDPAGNNDIIYFGEYPDFMFPGIDVVPYDLFLLKGRIYYDSNQNGIEDAGDFGMMYFPVGLNSLQATQTSVSGNYILVTDSTTQVIAPLNMSNWNVTSDSSSYTITPDTLVIDSLDFGLYPANITYEAEVTLTPGFPRCNDEIPFSIHYTNTGTAVLSGTIRFVMDNQLGFINSIPVNSSINGDTIEWTFTNLFPFEQRSILVQTSSAGLNAFDLISNCVFIYYNNGAGGGVEEDCADQVISCSYDPNDKAVKPAGVFGQHYTLLSDTLIYTIRFQNTGNDTAFVVRIRDTLDAALDPGTFRMIAASHPCNIIRNPSNNLLFEFLNILLPDSIVNEPASHGFVKFSVRAFAGTPIGTPVENTAHIFFDYNPAVVTNTTLNTLVDVIGIEEPIQKINPLLIYPNPAGTEALLVFRDGINEDVAVTISDISGRIIKQYLNVTEGKLKIDVTGMTSGIYICTAINTSGLTLNAGKLVVK